MDNNSINQWSDYDTGAEAQKRLESVTVEDGQIRAGDQVRLRPLGRADVIDLALDGKTATVVSIEQDFEDRIHIAVIVDDDPGRDMGRTGQPGHRFFFGVEEVERVR
jgi:hypothetical protein